MYYRYQALERVDYMKNLSSKEETKREKFVRLAEQRTNRILDGVRSLGKLSNIKNYEYSEQDVHKIFAVLTAELNRTKKLFKNSKGSNSKRFKL